MKKKTPQKVISRIWKIFLLLICSMVLFTIFQVVALKYINPFSTPNTAWEWAESIWTRNPAKQPVYIWKNIELISPHLQKAVIAAEDQRFFSHNGFDIDQIKQAIQTLVKRKRLRGASTISMQTARSVFWLSSRTITRKIAEVYYTVLIELIWDKQRILEMYLNTVDWGTGVTGAEAAARKYFSTSARNLTMEQAALMTAVLPNPHKWPVKNPSPYIQKRQIQIMKIMEKMPLLKN
ncbi:MAG: monofunctional biosynthetic peptidoglycan transglycosylase [Pseudomonadota bacterium]